MQVVERGVGVSNDLLRRLIQSVEVVIATEHALLQLGRLMRLDVGQHLGLGHLLLWQADLAILHLVLAEARLLADLGHELGGCALRARHRHRCLLQR